MSHLADSQPLGPGEVIVESSAGSLTQRIHAGRHHLVADEPVAGGGTDLGPDPYALLAAALGACTSLTIQLYAARKNYPLEGLRVHVRYSKTHAEDCEHCTTRVGMIDQLDTEIDLFGPLGDPERSSILAIAQRCPVHRTLRSEIHIQTRLKA